MPEVLELVPGDSVGPFKLGSTLFSVLNLLRTCRDQYPAVNVAWDSVNSGTGPVHVTLVQPAVLHLLFEPASQRLCRIEVAGLEPGSRVSYRRKRLQDHSTPLVDESNDVVRTVRRVLGPTYGSESARPPQGQPPPATEKNEIMLNYPGVAVGIVGDTMSRIVVTALPAPSQVSIEQAWLHPVLPPRLSITKGDIKLVRIMLDAAGKSATMQLHLHGDSYDDDVPSPSPSPISLQLGTTTSEDLLCDLGPAVRSWWKEDDRMAIHSSLKSTDPSLEPNPYFNSYPHLGLTFMLHPTRHVLMKMLLHSNLPGEINFGRTARVSWELVQVVDEESKRRDRSVHCSEGYDAVAAFLSRGGSAAVTLPTPARSDGVKDHKSKFESAAADTKDTAATTRRIERPMVLDRAADSDDGVVNGKQTEIYGHPGIAFEVTSGGDIETVWLF